MASMAPVAAITYSLLYGISTKQKVITIDSKRLRSEHFSPKKESSYSIGSLEEYAELLDDETVVDDGGYQGNVKLVRNNSNYKVQDGTVEKSNLGGEYNHTTNDSEASMRRR